MKIAINGMGRIGRCVFRAACDRGKSDIQIVALNGTMDVSTLAHLLMYDSVHGTFGGSIEVTDNGIIVDGSFISVTSERDINLLTWNDVDVVLECSGVYTEHSSASIHTKSGAKCVILSSPSNDSIIPTIVYGVNNEAISADVKVISIGSCTTNCLAPLAYVLHNAIGIESGFALTVHSYTNDQNVMDATHKDLRRARSCAMSMIPTSTGAARAIGAVLPDLAGLLDGAAIRVPTPNVSFLNLTFNALTKTTSEAVNDIIKNAAMEERMKKVIQYCDKPLVSIDFNHTTYSSIFYAMETCVVSNSLVRIASWYDNEFAFSLRMLDVAVLWYDLYRLSIC